MSRVAGVQLILRCLCLGLWNIMQLSVRQRHCKFKAEKTNKSSESHRAVDCMIKKTAMPMIVTQRDE